MCKQNLVEENHNYNDDGSTTTNNKFGCSSLVNIIFQLQIND